MKQALEELADSRDAIILKKFYKTGPGEYGENDLFRGVRVPKIRKLLVLFAEASLSETTLLLQSPYHEDRLFALLLLVKKYRLGDEKIKAEIYRIYLSNLDRINNWDLVDQSAEHIVGAHLFERCRRPLYKLAVSELLWARRVAIVSTFYFIKQNDFHDTLRLAELLIKDQEDLIHKATGWMLREVGKRNTDVLENFLKKNIKLLPRTALRYAIERFSPSKRRAYLSGTV